MRPWLRGLLAATLVAAACSENPDLLPEEPPEPTISSTTAPGSSEAGAAIPEVAAPDPDPTPLPVDPDVRIGTLDNGLTYYLRSNDAPGGNLELRLVVDAGSLQQAAPDDGSAHFLEHMLFNGTEQFPGNELDRTLQRLGIQFGPELNAFTSFDETVYLLAATTADPTAVDTAFDVLAEWASAATIDPAAVADEIGVVREELRFRTETSDGIVATAFEDIYTAGTIYAGHGPIGSREGIETTTAERLRSYYDRWYRPDNMAVVAVGDLPVDRMEDEVAERFGSVTSRVAEVPDDIDRRIVANPEPTAHVVTHPDQVVDNLSFDIPLTVWDEGTVGGERLVVMENLIARMLTNRLDEAFVRGDLGLDTSPGLELFEIARGLRYIGTNFQADDIVGGIDDFMSVLLGLARAGFTTDDVAAAAEWYRAGLDAELATVATRQDGAYAFDYLLHFLEGTGIDAVASTVERQRSLLDDVTPAELRDHWRWILQTGGPIVVAVGPDAEQLPTAAELVAAVRGATAAAGAEGTSRVEELMARPAPIDPAGTRTDDTLYYDATTWEFPNGASVVHAFSDVVVGSVDVRATGNGGWSTLPVGSSAITDFVTRAVDESGRGEIGPVALDRFLDGASVTLSSFIDETEEGFVGNATTEDLEILFQLLHLTVTSPRADEAAVRVARNDAENLLALTGTDPGLRAAIEAVDARTGGDPWYRIAPSPEQLEDLDADTVLDLQQQRFGRVDDLVVAVVGDVSVDAVEELARHYVGTLPAGVADTWTDRLPPVPDGIVRREVALDDDVTAAGIDLSYSTDLTLDAELETTSRVLDTILETGILETVREDLGASYTLTVDITPTRRPRPSIDTYIRVDGDPDRLDEILATVDAEIDRIVVDGPTADEFERAVAILASEYDFIDNALLLDAILARAHFPDADRLEPDDRATMLGRVTAGDVRSLAGRLLPSGRRIEVIRTTS